MTTEKTRMSVAYRLCLPQSWIEELKRRKHPQTAARCEEPTGLGRTASFIPATKAWKNLNWWDGVEQKVQSRFSAILVRPAHRDYWRSKPRPEGWLLTEWPAGESEPARYWLLLSAIKHVTCAVGTYSATGRECVIKVRMRAEPAGLAHRPL